MAWKIELLPEAARELKKLDRTVAARIVRTLEHRIAALDDPRSIGSPLTGDHASYWRWRVGDYRIVAQVRDETLVIVVIRIGHRREVYR